jgi:hypothetical protein
MPCSCKKCKSRSCVKPDLTLYYTVDVTKGCVINKLKFGGTQFSILQTVFVNLTDKKSNIVGLFTSDALKHDASDSDGNGKVESNTSLHYNLKDGNISSQVSTIQSVNSQGETVFPSGVKIVSKIISGEGIYLNATGYVVTETNNFDRKVKIYFTNKHKK